MLHEGLLDTRFSLAESRLLWELAHTEQTTATELAATLELDAGYLSRLLRGFKERGLVKASRSASDARQTRLSITAAGRRAFAPLDRRSQAEVAALLGPLSDAQQRELLAAMARIEALLGARARTQPFVLRAHRPGDIGWVVSRHGALYAQEYGWDMRFEALVAQIAASFVERFDAAREACWIAERDGSNLGSVFLVQARDEATQAVEPGTAQLRMLLVEPSARGLGLGVALVNECERFARQRGLPPHPAVDQQPAAGGARHLPARRLQAAGQRAAPQLRPRPGGRDLGAGPGLTTGRRPGRAGRWR